MKSPLLILLIILGLSLSAQVPEELWSGTTTVRVSTSEDVVEGQRIKRLLHRSTPEEIVGVSEGSIGALMFTAFLEGRLQAYTDLYLENKLEDHLLQERFLGRDTVEVIDPITFEASSEQMVICHNPADYYLVNLHLRLSYHADGSIQQKIISASLDYIPENPQKFRIYFKVDQLDEALAVYHQKWKAVDRMSFQVPFNFIKTRKNSKLSLSRVMKHLTKLILATDGKGFSSTADWSSDVDEEVFTVSGALSCSLIVVDPITFEAPEIKYVDRSMHTKVNRIRLYQYWAWDERTARLIISPIGYAPIMTERDETGRTLFNYPAINWAQPWYRKD